MTSSSRRSSRRQPVRSARSQQRRQTIRELEPVDYSQDYAYVRRDLIRIALLGGILMATMIAFYFIR